MYVPKWYDNHYAYPAVNVSSMETANAVLKGLADAKSDGIVQVSVGGAEFASGLNVKDKVLGAISLADHVRLMAEKYNVIPLGDVHFLVAFY